MATSRTAEQVGRVLGGRYRLLAPLGSGASAQVFLADDVELGRRVAVKVLHSSLADDDAFLRRFRAEARAAAALTHPHIMAVYDWDDREGPYVVFTELFLRERGYCCESGCRHCPWGYRPDQRPEADPFPEE